MSSVAKLFIGLGLLIAAGALVLGFTLPVGGSNSDCSGAFSSSHPRAAQTIQMYSPNSMAAVRASACPMEAERARPGYFVAMGIGALIAFSGLLIAARRPKFTPVAAELASLASLREQGHITQSEFEVQKQRLLGNGPV